MRLLPWAWAGFEQLLMWGWVAVPALPIVAGWRRSRRTPGAPRHEVALLLLASASYAWLLLSAPFPWLLGPSYEAPRYVILLANLAGMLVLAPWAAVRAKTLKVPVTLAALVIASLWFFAFLANAVL